MAIKLLANYAKRLGLPGYSSHQFSVSVETELHEVNDIAQESQRLYQTLQTAVDEQIKSTGFVPPDGYGMSTKKPATTASNGNPHNGSGANGTHNGDGNNGANGAWTCSDKQRELIEKIVQENSVDKNEVEELAQSMFGKGVKALNRLDASGLIDELLVRYGRRETNAANSRRQFIRKGICKKGNIWQRISA